MYDMVQAVRRFGLADPRLARHPFRDIRLLHSDSTVAAGPAQTAPHAAASIPQPIEKKSDLTEAES
jgi:hypothetical protein